MTIQEYPGRTEFAFTILDDTDDATVANAAPFYTLLKQLGLSATKTVWPLATPREEQGPFFAGATLADPAYTEWIRQLAHEGFEIASHNASMASSQRARTLEGLEAMSRLLGVSPRLHANHGQNLENLYWGAARYRSPVVGLAARVFDRLLKRPRYEGHVEASPYFWGDISKRQFTYVRSFAFRSLDTYRLPIPPIYRDTSTPWVNSWFITADAPDVRAFQQVVTRAAVDRLRQQRGHVIISTHIGKGFVGKDGRVHAAVADVLGYIASLNGWFVPASTLLDYLASCTGVPVLTASSRLRMDLLHVSDRVRNRLLSST